MTTAQYDAHRATIRADLGILEQSSERCPWCAAPGHATLCPTCRMLGSGLEVVR